MKRRVATVCVLMFLMALSAFAAERVTSLATGKNNLPVSMDKFPAFRHDKAISSIEVWIFYEDTLTKDSYIKQLQGLGFKTDDGMSYQKGNLAFFADDEDDSHVVVFSLSNINKPVQTPAATVLQEYPPFMVEQFGTMYSVDVDIYYNDPIPQAVLDGYVKELNAAGFKYDKDDDDYNVDVDSRQYYFEINDDDSDVYYTWSILYF